MMQPYFAGFGNVQETYSGGSAILCAACSKSCWTPIGRLEKRCKRCLAGDAKAMQVEVTKALKTRAFEFRGRIHPSDTAAEHAELIGALEAAGLVPAGRYRA